MPTIRGLLETAIYVDNLQRAAEFYRRVFNFGTLLESERLIALDVVGRDVLLLFKKGATTEPFSTTGGVIPGHGGSGSIHFAFAIDKEELSDWEQRLQTQGIRIESKVIWEGKSGAQSLYFRDPDNHLVELITPGFWKSY